MAKYRFYSSSTLDLDDTERILGAHKATHSQKEQDMAFAVKVAGGWYKVVAGDASEARSNVESLGLVVLSVIQTKGWK